MHWRPDLLSEAGSLTWTPSAFLLQEPAGSVCMHVHDDQLFCWSSGMKGHLACCKCICSSQNAQAWD